MQDCKEFLIIFNFEQNLSTDVTITGAIKSVS